MNCLRVQSAIRDTICYVVCFCLIATPLLLQSHRALADRIIDEANKGQDTGLNFLFNYQTPSVIDAAPPPNASGYFDGSGNLRNEVWSQELFPGYNPADPTQHGNISALGANPQDLSTQGIAEKFNLQGGTNNTANAYNDIEGASNNPYNATIDMRTEAFLDRSRDILSGNDAILDEILTACAEDVTAGSPGADTVTRLEDIWTCSQAPSVATGSCTVTRDYVLVPRATQVVYEIVGAPVVAGPGPDCQPYEDPFLIPIPYDSAGFYECSHTEFNPDHPILGPWLRSDFDLDGSAADSTNADFIAHTNVVSPPDFTFPSMSEPTGVVHTYTSHVCGGDTWGPITDFYGNFVINSCSTREPYIFVNAPTAPYQGMCMRATEIDGLALSPACSGPVTAVACPAKAAACQAKADDYLAMCQQADTYGRTTDYASSCSGGGTGGGLAPLLNGTETITASSVGPGVPNVQVGQTLFGDVFTVTETPFNPGDYGLIAGEYVIANHVVNGDGITSSTINDAGGYDTNWDYSFTATAVDSTDLTVEATLYEIVSNGFTFSGCTQSDVQNLTNGSCTGSVTCTDYTPPCRVVNGATLCEEPSSEDGATQTLASWNAFTNGLPEMCWSADVDIVDCVIAAECVGTGNCTPDCNTLPVDLQAECLADPCWTDAQGNQVCLDSTSEIWTNNLGEVGWVDNCADLIGKTECELQPEIACVGGMESDLDPNNIDACQLRQRFFDCGYDVTIPGVPDADDVDVTCAAEVRCFGDECSNTISESNPDFAKAAVAATAVTEATKDMDCPVQGDPTSCTVFNGAHDSCTDPMGWHSGIYPDCCADARSAARDGGDFVQYMKLAKYSYDVAQKPVVAGWISQGVNSLPSGLQNAVNAPADIGAQVGSAVTSGWNSAMQWAGFDSLEIATEATNLGGQVGSSAGGFGPIQRFVATGVNNFLRSIGADGFANALFGNATGQVTAFASSGLGSMVASVFSVIGWIYLIYQIATILQSIFFRCEEEELAFGIKEATRSCHFVGEYCSKRRRLLFGSKKCVEETESWCCFSSPFSRIINQQLRLQGIGPDWGTSEVPNCTGIPITDLEFVDWDLVDLSEWEAIIFEAGLVPDPRNPPSNFVPTESHPGVATGGSGDGATSTDTNINTINIVMPGLDDARFDLRNDPLYQPDVELMPWYDDGVP